MLTKYVVLFSVLYFIGKIWILQCLLNIRKILLADDNRYLLNDLYITDYIVWLQKQKADRIQSLSSKLNNENIDMEEIPFDIKLNYAGMEESSSSEEESEEEEEEETTDSDDQVPE